MLTSHLSYAHTLWRSIIQPGDQVVDATLGNGHDCLALAKMLNGSGHLIGYDIQADAVHNTKQRLAEELSDEQKNVFTELRHCCHTEIEASHPKLIVYNLGYLPGSDKTLTTQINSTLISLQKAQTLLLPGGLISMTLYPGHPEGLVEQEQLLLYTKSLPKQEWLTCWLQWPNRIKGPSLLLFQKIHTLPTS